MRFGLGAWIAVGLLASTAAVASAQDGEGEPPGAGLEAEGDTGGLGVEAEGEASLGGDAMGDLGLDEGDGDTMGEGGSDTFDAPPEPAPEPVVAEPEEASSASDVGPLVLGAEVGALFPQPFTELGTHVAFGIEVGFRLPFWDQRLEIFLDAGYSPPGRTFSDGPYDGELDQKELHFSAGPRIRFLGSASAFNASIALGGRIFLLESLSNGEREGQPFAEFAETSTQAGFFAALGAEYILGPGAIFLDVDLGWSPLPHTITGDVSTGSLSTTVGYRFFLL